MTLAHPFLVELNKGLTDILYYAIITADMKKGFDEQILKKILGVIK